jgi:hypothetical protein
LGGAILEAVALLEVEEELVLLLGIYYLIIIIFLNNL